ncbi:Alpha/Beta hydrolase protein [Xylariaceae sp. FL0016]|nr:Alpha/Beta hydrolase protein [Xylariaceae sp. FL0016]
MVSRSLAAAVCCLAVPVISFPTTRAENEYTTAPTVTVKNGTYEGVYSAGYDQDFFLGMPYAQTPARFEVSQPLDTAWEGTHEATQYSKACIGYGSDEIGYELSEDCLYLNVIRPAGLDETADLPVAFWIHGGGLFEGSGGDRRYNLSFIVENSVNQGTPMIGVSINYRLSAFGFLSGSQAQEAGLTNIGFRDQRLALQWVSENIAAFGGSPDKVTIWGESSGAESVAAQVAAYGGRDDGLFRGAIAESGFGSVLHRYAGGLNATTAQQETFDNLVRNTSCADTVGTSEAIPCLSELPFEEINEALNVTAVGPWPPVLDGDFLSDYPSAQFERGDMPHIPIMIGANTDEGSAFGSGMGPNGTGVDTDAEFAEAIRNYIGSNATTSSGMSTDEIIDTLMYLYPNIQAVGIPSLETWPEIVTPETEDVESLGLQYRRTGALFGDAAMQYLRRKSNIAWSNLGLKSWAYRFNVVVNGIPLRTGATHFQEVAFVFDNTNGVGYPPVSENPFEGEPESYYELAFAMSSAWVNFITGLDPNGENVGVEWPVYNVTDGGGVGKEIVWSANGSFVELDDFRAGGMKWMADHSVDIFGA